MLDASNPVKQERKRVVTIIHRVMFHYRVPFFRALSRRPDLDVLVVHGNRSIAYGHPAHIGELPFKTALAQCYRVSAFGMSATFQPASLRAVTSHSSQLVIAEGTFNVLTNFMVALYCRLSGRKFIWWVGGWERPESRTWARNFIRWYSRMAIRPANAFIAYGTAAKDYLVRLGASPEDIFLAHNSIDTDGIFANLPDYVQRGQCIKKKLDLQKKKVLLSVGALLPKKRIDTLIEAYSLVRKEVADVALVIVGDGPCRRALEEWVEMQSVRDVVFVGRIEEANPYFSMADIFVLPGLGGLALNQAMAFGKPVICSEADGTERDLVVEGINGHIVKPGDENALAEVIGSLITDDERLRDMGKESLRIVKEKVNLQNMVSEFAKAIHHVCNEEG